MFELGFSWIRDMYSFHTTMWVRSFTVVIFSAFFQNLYKWRGLFRQNGWSMEFLIPRFVSNYNPMRSKWCCSLFMNSGIIISCCTQYSVHAAKLLLFSGLLCLKVQHVITFQRWNFCYWMFCSNIIFPIRWQKNLWLHDTWKSRRWLRELY